MYYNLAYCFLFFLIFAVVGWCIEVTLTFYQYHKFVDRGFLIGPYCPIYGFGVLLITSLLDKYTSSPLVVFVLAMAICMVLEYVTSYVMEKLFKARWWDYSDEKFNINGRICLETTVPFGLGGLFIMYVVYPFVNKTLLDIPKQTLMIIALVLFILFVLDNIISLFVLSKVRMADIKPNKDNTEEITKRIREYLKGYSVLTKRLTEAFPNFKSTIRFKDRIEDLKEKSFEVKREMLEELKEKQAEIKAEIKKLKKEKKKEKKKKKNK